MTLKSTTFGYVYISFLVLWPTLITSVICIAETFLVKKNFQFWFSVKFSHCQSGIFLFTLFVTTDMTDPIQAFAQSIDPLLKNGGVKSDQIKFGGKFPHLIMLHCKWAFEDRYLWADSKTTSGILFKKLILPQLVLHSMWSWHLHNVYHLQYC